MSVVGAGGMSGETMGGTPEVTVFGKSGGNFFGPGGAGFGMDHFNDFSGLGSYGSSFRLPSGKTMSATSFAPPPEKTFEEQLNELTTTITPTAERPSMRDRIKARRATRGSDNPVNPVMDWLSGTDWSEGRKADERPVLANLGSKLKDPKAWLNALSFVNPQIAMLNRAINMGQAFKKDPKEAGLGFLGALIGNRFGARGQNIFNVARGIRGGDTFKQGLGNLFGGELLGRMGKNRDVGEGILSMLSGRGPKQAFGDFAIGRMGKNRDIGQTIRSMMRGKDPSRAFGDLALRRAGRQIDPKLRPLFGAGVESFWQGRPAGEAFGSAFKGMAGDAGKKYMFQRAYQKGGMPLVRRLQAVISLMGGGGG